MGTPRRGTMVGVEEHPTDAGPRPSASADRLAVATGGAAGLLVLVLAAITWAVGGRTISGFDRSGWPLVLFLVVLAGYVVAGWVTQRRSFATDSPLIHGAAAGAVAFAAWIPLRIVIWAVRDEHRGLITGHDPALRIGQVFAQVLFAVTFGMLGAVLARRSARRRDQSPSRA